MLTNTTYLEKIILAIGDSKSTIVEENGDKKKKKRAFGQHGTDG